MVKLDRILPASVLEKYINIDNILKAGIFKLPFLRPEFLERANKCLIVLLAFLVIFFLADIIMFNPSRSVKKIMASPDTRGEGAGRAARRLKEVKDYSYYSAALSEKQVFGTSFAPVHESAPESPAEIALIGIIPGDRPQAIIENKTTQDVYYVYEGDTFENFIVEEIDNGKVVLYSEGQRIELSFF